jgi:hypothetical protein
LEVSLTGEAKFASFGSEAFCHTLLSTLMGSLLTEVKLKSSGELKPPAGASCQM